MSTEIFLSVVSLVGMAAVSRHEYRLLGFILCACGNVMWIGWGLLIIHWEYVVLFGGYLIFNLIGTHDEYSAWKTMRDYNDRRARN